MDKQNKHVFVCNMFRLLGDGLTKKLCRNYYMQMQERLMLKD